MVVFLGHLDEPADFSRWYDRIKTTEYIYHRIIEKADKYVRYLVKQLLSDFDNKL